jgi:pimeloyl-ACP methyl ester carboxylesterase
MNALRTPEERFAALPDFPYTPRYVDDLPGLDGLRVAYIDEGGPSAETVLCLHGQPTWSFLYRKMIPVFVEAGARVVAPDLLGFGRSDKPIDDDTYTFDLHREMLLAFVERLDLRDITAVVQDWGGVLGLTLPVDSRMDGRVRRLLIMNTALATGRPAGPGFDAWRTYAGSTDDLPIARLMQRAHPGLPDEDAAAYEAPYPDKSYKAGVRRFPQMVMTEPGMPGIEVSKAAVEFWRREWDGPVFMAVGAKDPIFTPQFMSWFATRIRNCPDPLLLEDAGHFVQECGDVVARAALEHYRDVEPRWNP